MFAELLTISDYPTLSPKQTRAQALQQLTAEAIEQAPVVENGVFWGLTDRNAIEHGLETDGDLLREMPPNQLLPIHAHASTHLLEVVRLIQEQSLNVLPILDEDDQYHGVLQRRELFFWVGSLASFRQPGAIIVLEMPWNQYSPAKITAIAESNQAKVLTLLVHQSPENADWIIVTMKFDVLDTGSIVRAYERYSYVIRHVFQPGEGSEDARQHYDALMRFLEI